MSPGVAADLLRRIVAAKGSCAGLDATACYEAIEAAPVGTVVGCFLSSRGNFPMVKLADGWGYRTSKPAPGATMDSRGCPNPGSPFVHIDEPMGLRTPQGQVRWDSIRLPADAPTGAPEALLRAFAVFLGVPVPDERIAAFLATHPS